MTLMRIDGMLDPHTHLRGMRWSHKGTFASETAAALHGGYWAVFDMPNTPPATLTRAALNQKVSEFASQALCDWAVYFGASPDGNWHEYADVSADVCGLKIYNNATTGDLLIEDQAVRQQHYQHWPEGKIIAVHAEEETMLDILALVRQYRKPTHFCHVSTAKEVGYLRAAKAEGLPISIAVCPHHLFLTETDLPRLDSLGMMKPTLKTQADQDALWDALRDGLIDIVESDHAPHTLAEKSSDAPPYGVTGLQTTLPLLISAAQQGRLPLDRISLLVAENPRRIFGVKCPAETYCMVDLDARWVIEREHIVSLCGWSPFEGMAAAGRVCEVWIRGVKVFDGERILVTPGFGRNIFG